MLKCDEHDGTSNAIKNFHKNNTLSKLFAETAVKFAHRIAVQDVTCSITYHELNTKANQLANHLRTQGVTTNTIVVLYFGRSIEFIIGILAVIKSGGLYLPIYSEEAPSRCNLILEDSNAKIILTDNRGAENLKENVTSAASVAILDITQFFSSDLAADPSNPSEINTAEDPAYVIYTSGSTGVPKGCVIPQRGIIRLVKHTNYICIEPSDVMANMSNPAFDASTFEIWGALLNGAVLCIVPNAVLLSPPDFANFFRSQQISMAFITTALVNLIAKIQPDAFDNLRCLLFAGEQANIEIVQKLLARKLSHNLNNLTLIHTYGPTECSTFATFFMVQYEKDIVENVPIGHSITNTKAYVLDKNLKLTQPKEIGEIYLSGDGLALGYLNDPEQTANKFIVCPWDKTQTLYKTGDLAFWLPTVGVVFFGRDDRQVKINGFKVEISEIEACITKHPMVQHTTVVVKHAANLEKSLCAYVNFRKEFNNFKSFHQYLKTSLPHYMLPQKIIKIDYIPLNHNGKIDQSKLESLPGQNILELCTEHQNINNIEKNICLIWQDILSISRIDCQQNIFDFGANSLILMQVCLQINEQLNNEKKINVSDLLSYPTVKSLAEYINLRQKQKSKLLANATDRGRLRHQKIRATN